MINFKPTIGIEVHAALNTNTKMFSPAVNKHMAAPNTLVNVIDLGFPGIMPTVNKGAVIKAMHLADALNMDMHADYIQFDRKNYFYPDLPKGFQITQQYHPIGTDGYIEINDHGEMKRIGVERIHMEEDTAKQTICGDVIELDFNRCGSPLIEIVSKPEMHSAYQAAAYLTNLRKILRFANVSDAKMEQGSMRADINISVAPVGADYLGTKVEIKNINTINNVMKAIEYEIQRQIGLILTNQEVHQETRRYDEDSGTTVFMRAKSNAIDYCYITEPNITTVRLSDHQIQDIMAQKPASLAVIQNRLLAQGLDQTQADSLFDNYEMYLWYEAINQKVNQGDLVYKWLNGEMSGLFNKKEMSFDLLDSFLVDNVAEMLTRLIHEEINGKQAKSILECLVNERLDVQTIIDKFGFKQITNEAEILAIVQAIAATKPNLIDEFIDNPNRIIKQLMGLVMKETNGQANPIITNKVVVNFLDNLN